MKIQVTLGRDAWNHWSVSVTHDGKPVGVHYTFPNKPSRDELRNIKRHWEEQLSAHSKAVTQ